MLGLLERCFAGKLYTEAWQSKLREMIPSYGKSLAKDEDLLEATRARTSEVLDLVMLETQEA
jgi:malate dehydrogenase (quinone)